MDTARITEAARKIAERQKALSWLEEYGVKLKGRDDIRMSVRLSFAGSCHGADKATELLESYAALAIPDVVQSAIACCRADIEIHRATIREETDRYQP